jgi:hypothetical protein
MSKLTSRATEEIYQLLLGENGIGDQLREYTAEEDRIFKREIDRVLQANFDDVEEKAWQYDELQ